jgi:hypothetical protein
MLSSLESILVNPSRMPSRISASNLGTMFSTLSAISIPPQDSSRTRLHPSHRPRGRFVAGRTPARSRSGDEFSARAIAQTPRSCNARYPHAPMWVTAPPLRSSPPGYPRPQHCIERSTMLVPARPHLRPSWHRDCTACPLGPRRISSRGFMATVSTTPDHEALPRCRTRRPTPSHRSPVRLQATVKRRSRQGCCFHRPRGPARSR